MSSDTLPQRFCLTQASLPRARLQRTKLERLYVCEWTTEIALFVTAAVMPPVCQVNGKSTENCASAARLLHLQLGPPTCGSSRPSGVHTPCISRNDFRLLCEAIASNNTLLSIAITEFDFGLRQTCMQNLCKAIAENSFLCLVDLCNNNFGNNGALALAHALKKNKSVRELLVPNNAIWKEGLLALADAIEQNTTLCSLVLRFQSTANATQRNTNDEQDFRENVADIGTLVRISMRLDSNQKRRTED